MPTRENTQLALDEEQVANDDLEQALEDRQSRKNSRDELNRLFNEAHEKVIGLIEAANIVVPDDGAIRVGRFRLTKAISRPREVSFTTEEKSRVKIDYDE